MRTPLHWAACDGHAIVAQVLLKAGASVRARDKVREVYFLCRIFVFRYEDGVNVVRAQETVPSRLTSDLICRAMGAVRTRIRLFT